MKVHITNLYGQSPYSVALMAQNMVSEIAKALNFKEIGIYSFNADSESVSDLAIRFDGMNAAISNGDIVVFQSPTWNGTHFDLEYIKRLKIYNGLKIVIFVHDVVPLMFKYNYFLIEKTIEMYNLADLLILPSEKMFFELKKEGLKIDNVIFQNFWDHTTNVYLEKPIFSKVLNFSGNPNRFEFIKNWKKSVNINLFSDVTDLDFSNINVKSKGWLFADSLLKEINNSGGFGLVWHQTEDSEYYDLNVSYKLSTYIAAGLPVIVPSTISSVDYIKKNNLGFVANTLDEVNDIIENITEEQYYEIVDNIWEFRKLIVNGYFSKKILIDSIHKLIM